MWSTEGIEGDDDAMDGELPEEPQLLTSIRHEGSVTDIKVGAVVNLCKKITKTMTLKLLRNIFYTNCGMGILNIAANHSHGL